ADPGQKSHSIRQREGDLEAGATEFGGAADFQFAAVGRDDVLDDGQADAVALDALVAADAALEDALDILRCDARAVVLDADAHARAAAAGGRRHFHGQQHPVPGPLEG